MQAGGPAPQHIPQETPGPGGKFTQLGAPLRLGGRWRPRCLSLFDHELERMGLFEGTRGMVVNTARKQSAGKG